MAHATDLEAIDIHERNLNSDTRRTSGVQTLALPRDNNNFYDVQTKDKLLAQ